MKQKITKDKWKEIKSYIKLMNKQQLQTMKGWFELKLRLMNRRKTK